ncbi:TetR family transcriptional regulator [Barrientosiimonas humi]|uniref:TetR family transcriptional regulator n=2 Tax=Barrientosiimonas TaxID=1535207 RepID=A0A542X8M2_9MICO|nr:MULTISPECIES: TetR family transcriptional regulator [Barrientosiimonas]TQL32179.1 TetR family transcriptional regulator [Barrientosiimonas humi]BDZ56911.1 TetR family transcriptional regulator [Barrientosiimonas endolithica]CAG7572167.1 putative HTH-type transcriptional regulator [Barrientosiimonas humi]
MTPAEPAPQEAPRPDGRDVRWAEHRKERRRQLVEAALRAIRTHGPTVGMDEISAVAGTSKTVVYRHLGDRVGLYLAVCESVDELILSEIQRALADSVGEQAAALRPGGDPRPALTAVIDSYLRLVERDPEVYRFVTRRPIVDGPLQEDPMAGLSDTVATALAEVFTTALNARGLDADAAETWAHGLVGFVRESADRWLVSPDRAPREVVVAQLADLAAFGVAGILNGPPASRGDTT